MFTPRGKFLGTFTGCMSRAEGMYEPKVDELIGYYTAFIRIMSTVTMQDTTAAINWRADKGGQSAVNSR